MAFPADTSAQFAAWTQEHRGVFWKVARAFAAGEADQADLVQEMQLQLWRAMPETYRTEQSYVNMVACLPGVEFVALDVEWNRMLHYYGNRQVYDARTPQTKMVHVMFPAADHQDAAWHQRIVNPPIG